MRTLALDTSTVLGTVAVTVDGQLRAELSARVQARHGESVFELLEAALRHARLERGELDLVAVGIGPGSFTGTRVGVATAKGLALALDAPLVGVVTLRALATACPGARVATAVDAHKGEVFLAAYERAPGGLRTLVAPDNLRPEEAVSRLRAHGPLALVGSGIRRYADAFAGLEATRLDPVFDVPRAAWIARLGEARFAAHGADDRALLEPLYLRASDATLPG